MKRLFVLLLSGILLASSVPTDSYAANDVTAADPVASAIKEDSAVSSAEPTTAGLEKVILSVKSKIAIPKEYSEFNYYFYGTSSYADAYWSLTWSNPKTYANIQVNCDADNHITYFYQYDSAKKTTGVPKYLKKELQAAAEDFIYKIAPDLKNKIRFTDASFDGVYSKNYTYHYQRINAGVAFPDNGASVSVNSVTGEVTSASVNWLYDAAVPSSATSVSKEEAAKLIKENMQMKLVYRSNSYIIYDKGGINNGSQTKAFLVYEPTLNYISIDAKTGKVYLDRSEWVDVSDENGALRKEAGVNDSLAGSGSADQTLTEEEAAKIEELKGLISKSKAIDIVTSNSSLYLDKNLKSFTATLNKTVKANKEDSYVWYVTLSDPRKVDYNKDTDYYRAYARATVDAKTGKILAFYSSMKSYFDEKNQTWTKVTIPYSKEDGRATLEKFLKSQVKDYFENSVLVSTNDDYIAYYDTKESPVYGGYSYQYNRVNEKVEYPYNNIYGSVDGVTGKIYSYGSYWDDSVVFESTKGVMTADKAMDYYLGKDGFGLKYEINVINKYDSSYESLNSYYDYTDAYSVDYEVRLVYRPDVTPAFISPFTGEQLNYNGEVFKETVPYTYQDIKDTPENRSILLLADMNVGFEGDNFLPDKTVTVGEVNQLLQAVGYGYPTEDEKNTDKLITREELAQNFILKMGLEKVSKLAGIYRTGYADENKIGSDYLGAVALAKGLGLMAGDADNNFNAKNNVTRFEAVDLLLNFIAVQQQDIIYY
jgi:hypothetical protein